MNTQGQRGTNIKIKTPNTYKLILLAIVLLATSYACTGKIFDSTQIFIRETQFTDTSEIDLENPLANHDGFVFFPDGTFESKIEKDGIAYEFSGNYSADDIGNEFAYYLFDVIPSSTLEELNIGDGLYNCQSNTDEDFFACIELRMIDDVIRFSNIE